MIFCDYIGNFPIYTTVGPCIVRPKYPKKGVHYAKPHYVKPHYTSAWIV